MRRCRCRSAPDARSASSGRVERLTNVQDLTIEWRGDFENGELNALHAKGFEHPVIEDDWLGKVSRHSLGWVCARHAGRLIGFVNVAWDGGVHAFLLDTVVTAAFRRQGTAVAMVDEAAKQARTAGCEWLHVDFEPHLKGFYLDRCGVRPTNAGLIALH